MNFGDRAFCVGVEDEGSVGAFVAIDVGEGQAVSCEFFGQAAEGLLDVGDGVADVQALRRLDVGGDGSCDHDAVAVRADRDSELAIIIEKNLHRGTVRADIPCAAVVHIVGCAVDAFYISVGAADLEAAQSDGFFGQIGCQREACREQQGDEEEEEGECFCFHGKTSCCHFNG